MNSTDIEFTVGLNTTPAEQKLGSFLKDVQASNNKIRSLSELHTSKQNKISNLESIYSRPISNSGSGLSQKDYQRFIKLRNERGRAEREIRKIYESRDSGIFQKIYDTKNNQTARENVLGNISKKAFGDIQTRALDEEVLRIKANQNKIASRGAFEKWKELTTPSDVLALPAPKTPVDDIFLNEYANKLNGNGGRNEFEERNLQKLLLQSQRRKASFDFSQAENDEERSDAVKRYTDADQALKALNEKQKKQKKESKETVQEEKALNREHDAGIIKLFKITSILYGIKKLIQGIGKLWKFEVDTNLATTARDVQEKGFFSTDARNALRSNTNKERASIARGLQYMGEAAPFQMGDFDSAVKALQDLRLKAISGQGIKDDQRVISLDRLTRRLGLNWNVGQMLSNPNLDLTGMLVDLSDAVERYLPKLDKLKDIDKNLTINDMLTVLGDKLMNAVVYHANYNARTGGTETMMEETKKTGSDAHLPIDFTKGAHEFALAFADSVASSNVLKKAFAEWIRPPVQGVVNFTSHVSAAMGQWFERSVLNRQGRSNIDSLFVASNAELHGIDWKERTADQNWYKANKSVILAEQEAFEKNSGYKTTEELLDYYVYNNSAGNAGTISQNVENVAIEALANKYNDIGAKNLDELLNNPSLSNDEVALIKAIKKDFRGYMPRNLMEWEEKIGYEKSFFKEGGVFDFKLGNESIEEYERRVIGDMFDKIFFNMLTDSHSILGAGGIYKSATITNDVDKDKRIDGEITIRLERTDGTYETHTVPLTAYENATKQVFNYSTNFN